MLVCVDLISTWVAFQLPECTDAQQVASQAETEDVHVRGEQPGDIERVDILRRTVFVGEGQVSPQQPLHIIGSGIVPLDHEFVH